MDQNQASEIAQKLSTAIDENLKDLTANERPAFVICLLVGAMVKAGLTAGEVQDLFETYVDLALKATEEIQKVVSAQPTR